MVQTRIIDLDRKIPGGASIEFLRVEKPVGKYSHAPFVLVRYSLAGEEQEYGLRLDLDKQVFLDHFDDNQEKEEVIQKAAPKIIEVLEDALSASR